MNDRTSHKSYLRLSWLCSAAAAIVALVVYLCTVEPTVSYWDCPEYVTTAARLEPGHPPGNPAWALTARMFTLFAPSAEHYAVAVNVMSAVCTAFAVMYLCLVIMAFSRRLLAQNAGLDRRRLTICSAAGVSGSLTFAFTDTLWFSALEAEVYAFSAMLTALMVWIAVLAAEHRGEAKSVRLLVLIGYLSGLSIGVHQLNLLCLPVVALIYLFYNPKPMARLKVAGALLLSLLAIVAMLFGVMPGVVRIAEVFDLFAVNRLGRGYNAGTLVYLGLTLAIFLTALCLTGRRTSRTDTADCLFASLALFMSGAVSFGGNPVVGAAISFITFLFLFTLRHKVNPAGLNAGVWTLGLILVGYGCYALIPVRGAASPPMNQGSPGDIFAFERYIGRDQYGSAPLIKGPTPLSPKLLREDVEKDSTGKVTGVKYKELYRDRDRAKYTADGKGRYVLTGYQENVRYAPETEMWFPRIHNGGTDIDLYTGWTGMTRENMDTVRASYAVDSAGNATGRLDATTGKREKTATLRPTYLQSLTMLAGYQTGYMYMRYLMWNFVGRQNEIYGQGECDAGNFITGIGPVDDLMLGEQKQLPAERGEDNPGHRAFYFVPFIIGILGIAYQLRFGMRGTRQLMVVAMLFVLTGLAIVVYLNQVPGQPRERDYSFVGSFYAFSIWIGLGLGYLVDLASRKKGRLALPAALATLALPAWMFAENLPDHNRSGRYVTRDYALNILLPLERDGIIFINGDNYTFPLWYLQETEGVRRDLRTVNIAYLSTPWYVSQLLTPSYGAAPVPSTLPDSLRNEASLHRFKIVRTAEGDTLDAVEALREAYTRPVEGLYPELRARYLRIAPVAEGLDSIVVDARTLASGRVHIGLDALITLDMVATNAAQGWKRPISRVEAIGRGNLGDLNSYMVQRGPVMALTGVKQPDGASNVFDWRSTSKDLREKYAWGGLDRGKVYVDLPGRRMAQEMRDIIIRTADSLASNGRKGEALRLAAMAERVVPEGNVPYSVTAEGVQISRQAINLAKVYAQAGDTTNARRVTLAEMRRALQNYRYFESLPASHRSYTLHQTTADRKTFYEPFEMWERLKCGDPEKALGAGSLRGIDMDKMRHDFMLDTERRWLIANARPYIRAASGSRFRKAFNVRLRNYLRQGGDLSKLELQSEFSGFPWLDTGF